MRSLQVENEAGRTLTARHAFEKWVLECRSHMKALKIDRHWTWRKILGFVFLRGGKKRVVGWGMSPQDAVDNTSASYFSLSESHSIGFPPSFLPLSLLLHPFLTLFPCLYLGLFCGHARTIHESRFRVSLTFLFQFRFTHSVLSRCPFLPYLSSSFSFPLLEFE